MKKIILTVSTLALALSAAPSFAKVNGTAYYAPQSIKCTKTEGCVLNDNDKQDYHVDSNKVETDSVYVSLVGATANVNSGKIVYRYENSYYDSSAEISVKDLSAVPFTGSGKWQDVSGGAECTSSNPYDCMWQKSTGLKQLFK